MRLKMRGTVSRLWAKTSGAAEKTSSRAARSPRKSGTSSSTPQPGAAAWICRATSA